MWKLILVLLISPILTFAQQDVYIDTVETKPVSDRYYIWDFESGTIILADNSVKSGLLRFNGNLFFKADADGKREKLNPKEVSKFFVGQDTFVVARNVTFVSSPLLGPSIREAEFFKVLEAGKASLYLNLATQSSPGMAMGVGGAGGVMVSRSVDVATYYISIKDSTFVYIPRRKKKFLTTILHLVQDNKQLVDDIKEGVLGYSDLDEIVRRYNLYSLDD